MSQENKNRDVDLDNPKKYSYTKYHISVLDTHMRYFKIK